MGSCVSSAHKRTADSAAAMKMDLSSPFGSNSEKLAIPPSPVKQAATVNAFRDLGILSKFQSLVFFSFLFCYIDWESKQSNDHLVFVLMFVWWCFDDDLNWAVEVFILCQWMSVVDSNWLISLFFNLFFGFKKKNIRWCQLLLLWFFSINFFNFFLFAWYWCAYEIIMPFRWFCFVYLFVVL